MKDSKTIEVLLHALLAVHLCSFLKSESSLADAGLRGFVVDFVDVSQDGVDLGFDFSNDLFHLS